MTTLHSVILVVHTLIAVLIIALVLLQRGKGADAGAAFGAGASGTVFGARGSSNFFSRTTGILATAFFISSLTLAYLSSQSSQPTSLMDEAVIESETSGPAEEISVESDLPALPESADAVIDDEFPALEDDAAEPPGTE